MNLVSASRDPAAMLGAWVPLIEAMPDAVWLVDGRTLAIVAANRQAAALFGTPDDVLVGREVLELAATPEDLAFWGEVAEGQAERIESETLMRRFDGRVVPVLRQVSRIERDGDAPLYVVVVHDRSEQVRLQRELEDSVAQLQGTLESSADGILVTDLAGRIRHCNRRFAEMWALPPELLARHDDDALLEWMRRSVTDPGAYMRRLAQIDEATMMQAADRIDLHSGHAFERVTMPHCSRGRPIGRVFSFRVLAAGTS